MVKVRDDDGFGQIEVRFFWKQGLETQSAIVEFNPRSGDIDEEPVTNRDNQETA